MKLQFIPFILIFYCFGFGRSAAYAQSYYHSPNDTLIAYTILDGQVTMNITQVHPTNDTLHFIWNLHEVSMPAEWEANICDNSACFTSLVASGATLPVLPGDNGLMLVHCTPHVTPGTGTIRYTIYELGSPAQVDTLTWIIHAATAGIAENASVEPLIYSTENTIVLSGNLQDYTEVSIYDQLGRVLVEKEFNEETKSTLPLFYSGLVWVELKGKSKTLTKKLFVCY